MTDAVELEVESKAPKLTPKIPGKNSREFLKFLRELRGISRVLSFFFKFLL